MRYKNVLITGCSSGFGLLTSVLLARQGYQVYATMRNLQKKDALMAECAKAAVEVNIRCLDVTKSETIAAVVDEIESNGGVDVLINNAGYGFLGFFEDTSNQDFHEQFETNFSGALNCTRAVLAGMRKRKHGLIINISSIAGLSGSPALSAYTASKFALEGWSECLRYELKPQGIDVVLIEPGLYKTSIFSTENRKQVEGYDNPQSPYHQLYPIIEKDIMERVEKHGQDPIAVANKIAKILKTERPKLRYIVGADARAEGLLKRLLPWFIFEFIMEKLVWGRYLKLI